MERKIKLYPRCTVLSTSLCLTAHGFGPAANNPEINYHMGMAHYKNNDKVKAREYLQKALELNHNFNGAFEARKVLDEIKGS
jgi:uncharacterized protein HemY